MGKYFKDENHLHKKRFKTSNNCSQQNLRFAQNPFLKAITIFDKFLDATKVIFSGFIKSSKLINVRPQLIHDLEQALIQIVEAKKTFFAKKQTELVANNNKIVEIDNRLNDSLLSWNIKNDLLGTKTQLETANAQLEKEINDAQLLAAKLINGHIDEFNKSSKSISKLKWDGNFDSPKFDFVLGSPISGIGSQIFLNRVAPQSKGEGIGSLVANLVRLTRKGYDAKLFNNLGTQLNNSPIGFNKKKHKFISSEGDVKHFTLYEVMQQVTAGNWPIGLKPENPKVLHDDFNELLRLLDQFEKGATLNNPALSSVIQLTKLAIGLVTSGKILIAPFVISQFPNVIRNIEQARNEEGTAKQTANEARRNLNIPNSKASEKQALETKVQQLRAQLQTVNSPVFRKRLQDKILSLENRIESLR